MLKLSELKTSEGVREKTHVELVQYPESKNKQTEEGYPGTTFPSTTQLAMDTQSQKKTTSELQAQWKKGKHGRFSMVGSIYKEDGAEDEAAAEEATEEASSTDIMTESNPTWKEGKHGRFSMAGGIYKK